jgi:hypothetical protein
MRKYLKSSVFILLCAVLLAGLSSCSKNDEGDIVGLWVFVNLTSDIRHSADPDAAQSEESMITLISLFLQGSTLEFKSDKTWVMTAVDEMISGTYTYDGDRFTMSANGQTADSALPIANGTSVSIKNDVLTIISDNLDEINSYSISGHEERTVTYREAGFTKYEVRMTFKK